MKKILPLNLLNGIRSECWHNQLVAMAITKNANLPWYIERFNDFVFDPIDCTCVYYRTSPETGYYTNFHEVIDCKKIGYVYDIKSLVINEIESDRYVSAYCDTTDLAKENDLHELLIVGYDDTGVYYFDYFKNARKISFMSFENFLPIYYKGQQKYKNASKNIYFFHGYCGQLSSYKVKNCPPRDVNISSLLIAVREAQGDIEENYRWGEFKVRYLHSHMTAKAINENIKLLGNLTTEKLRLYSLLVYKLHEARSNLAWKCKFLQSNQHVNFTSKFFDNVEVLCYLIDKAKNILIKMTMVSKKEKYLPDLSQILCEIDKLDAKQLAEAHDCLLESFMNSIT